MRREPRQKAPGRLTRACGLKENGGKGMRVLFVEGKEEAALRARAQALPHPSWLLAGEGVFLLQVFGAPEEALARAREVPGVKVWAFRLQDGIV